jgi:hypothetical protein
VCNVGVASIVYKKGNLENNIKKEGQEEKVNIIVK